MGQNGSGEPSSGSADSQKGVSCTYCSDTFASEATKRRHERNFHADELDHTCPDCGKAFQSRSGLHSHHAQLHDGRITGYDRECPECGSEFTTDDRTMTYCSPECGSAAQRKRVELTCEVCGDDFETVPSRADDKRFCSIECKGEWFSDWFSGENHPRYRENVVKPCAWCGEETETPRHRVEAREHGRVYCDSECADKWRSENVRGEDHPLYVDAAVECEWCGRTFQKRPAKQDAHDKQFCSRECHGNWISEHNTGEDHPRWKGGHVEYGEEWYAARRKALDRDNHTCQDCGQSQSELDKRLHVHHIQPVRTFENVNDAHELRNLVTLCITCHAKWEGLFLRPDPGVRSDE